MAGETSIIQAKSFVIYHRGKRETHNNFLWIDCSASPSDNINFMQNICHLPLISKNIRYSFEMRGCLIFFQTRGGRQMFCMKMMLSEGDALQ
jgi:hypothetical protein